MAASPARGLQIPYAGNGVIKTPQSARMLLAASQSGSVEQCMLAALDAIALYTVPPTKPFIYTTNLTEDGPVAIYDPFPPGTASWAITNNSAKNVQYWYVKTTTVPTNSIPIVPNGTRAYSVQPPALYVARSTGDTTANITVEYYLP